MIEADKRKAVFLLHQEGQSAREIARLLGLSPNTVRAMIAQGGRASPDALHSLGKATTWKEEPSLSPHNRWINLPQQRRIGFA